MNVRLCLFLLSLLSIHHKVVVAQINNSNVECIVIDFETRGNGTELQRGDYVFDDWLDEYGMTVTSSDGGVGPRIFDTSEPGTVANGDPDLGTPNQSCGGGPGVGVGGAEGQAGENCVALGNVLIIQESDKETPDDNARGGSLRFEFEAPVFFRTIGLLDMDYHETPMILWNGDTVSEIDIQGLGDNSVQNATIDKEGILSLTVRLNGSGAITFLDFCLPTVAPNSGEAETTAPPDKNIFALRDRLDTYNFILKDTIRNRPMDKPSSSVRPPLRSPIRRGERDEERANVRVGNRNDRTFRPPQ